MGKRLNPHRRLLAKQAAIYAAMRKHGNALDTGKLQEGRVRSGLDTSDRQGLKRVAVLKYMARPHSKVGNEPPARPPVPGSAKVWRY